MKCVICKNGEVVGARVQAEIKAGGDRVLVSVEAEQCRQCGETFYSPEVMRRLERVRENFLRKEISLASVGTVYRVA